jgi:hypothetical protein
MKRARMAGSPKTSQNSPSLEAFSLYKNNKFSW